MGLLDWLRPRSKRADDIALREQVGRELGKQWLRKVLVVRIDGGGKPAEQAPRLHVLAEETLKVIKVTKCSANDVPKVVGIILRHLPSRKWISEQGVMTTGERFYKESTGPDPYRFSAARKEIESALKEYLASKTENK